MNSTEHLVDEFEIAGLSNRVTNDSKVAVWFACKGRKHWVSRVDGKVSARDHDAELSLCSSKKSSRNWCIDKLRASQHVCTTFRSSGTHTDTLVQSVKPGSHTGEIGRRNCREADY